MKNTKRQAFTIVELVIVIAVIAILSAVLIPTFGAIIKDANIAAAQSAAATLTTELHVYLKGETIDSEEELMKALTDAKISEKLVPKALAYGYHFWFDMGTQTIFAAHPDEVEDMEPAKVTASAEQDGPALASATLIADEAITYANVGIRDVFDKGYFLITNCGDSDPLTKALGLVGNLKNGKDYVDLLSYLEKASADVANPTAELILNKIKTTTIRTEGGVFFYDGASTNEYISGSATFLAGPYYNYNTTDNKIEDATEAPVPTGAVKIPENITYIVADALNYKDGTATITLPMDRVSILSPGFTNSNVLINGVTYTIPTEITERNLLRDTAGVEADIPLKVKVPYANYNIGYVAGDFVTDADGKIYVAYRNEYLQLHAVNADNPNEISNRIEKWEVLAGDYGTFTIDETTGKIDLSTAEWTEITVDGKKLIVCEVEVKATANTTSADGVTKTATVVVIRPTAATLTVGNKNLALDSEAKTTLDFNGPSTSHALTASVNYSSDITDANPLLEKLQKSPKLDVECKLGLLYSDNNLTFEVDRDGKLANKVLNDYGFNIVIDNYYEASVIIEVNDLTYNAVTINYNQHAHASRPAYYIGSSLNADDTPVNEIKLSDLFTINNEDKFGNKATVTIYYNGETDGKLSPSFEINNYYDAYKDEPDSEFTLYADYDRNITLSADGTKFLVVDDKGTPTTDEPTIRFIGHTSDANDYPDKGIDYIDGVYDIYIEVAPENDKSTVLYVEIKDGALNVTNINDLAKTHTTDVVLHGNVEAKTGDQIVLGANDLYGNGYVISAQEYVASETTITLETDTPESIKCLDCEGEPTVTSTSYCFLCKAHVASDHNHYYCETCDLADNNSKDYSAGKLTNNYKYYCNHDDCKNHLNADMDKHNNIWGAHRNYFSEHGTPVNAVSTHTNNDTVYKKEPNTPVVLSKDYYLISVNGGTIDNIYLNGPVYPELQYKESNTTYKVYDSTTNTATAMNGVKTPYYVSGVLATGESKIVNSYLSGFRQPVKANGTKLSVENTTLRGGNFANLLLSDGNLTLKNVTTVQDQNGQLATVGSAEDKQKSVTGTGIAIEQTALDNTITIDGYLDQYNWIKQGTNALLPIIPNPTGDDLDMGVLFNAIFTGLPTSVGKVEINRLKRYMWKDYTSTNVEDKNNYVNTGIVFCEIGDTSYTNALRDKVNLQMIDETNRTPGYAGTNKFESLRMVFNEEGISLGPISINAVSELDTDGIFTIWSYKDGRDWERQGISFSTDIKPGFEKPHTVLDTTKDKTGSLAADEFVDSTPNYVYALYRGYYDNLGAYADVYKAGANEDNLVKNPAN